MKRTIVGGGVLFCLSGLLTLGCGDEGVDSRAGDSNEPGTPQLLVPLLASYTKWDYHVFQGLDEHPRFEMVELMLDDADGEEPLAWMFFTERELPKRQFHYTNDPDFAAGLSRTSSPETRIVETAPIDVTWQERADGRLSFQVALSTSEGAVSWDVLTTGSPTGEYAELISQSGHDLPGGILVMYLHDTVLVDPSTVLVEGTDTFPATVWKEKSSAYFTAYHGAVSPGLGHGYLTSATASYRLLSRPKSLAEGQSWVYEFADTGGVKEQRWSIVRRDEDVVEVASEPWSLSFDVSATGLLLRSMGVTDEDGGLLVRFEPPLPDVEHQVKGFGDEVSFAIDIDQVQNVMTGKVSVEVRDGDRVRLSLVPEQPSWAVGNPMEIVIDWREDGYDYASRTSAE
jgi:hypothetical protein